MPLTHKLFTAKFITVLILGFLSFILASCNLDSCNEGGMPDVEYHYIHRIYSVNLDGSGLKLVTTGGNFSLLPNGKILYINNSKLYMCNSDGSDTLVISPENLNVYNYTLYVGGTKVLLDQYSYPKNYLSFINLDGSGLTQLTIPPGYYSNLVVSPDGQKIAFTTTTGLYIMNTDGSGQKLVKDTTNKSLCNSISFTQDGNNIIYMYEIQQGYAHNLRLFNIKSALDTSLYYNDGGNPPGNYRTSKWNTILFSNLSGINLLNLNDYHYKFLHRGWNAYFSLDSTKVTFMDFSISETYEANTIFVMDLTNNSTRKININLPKNDIYHAELSSDGIQVFFQADTSWQIIHKAYGDDGIVY